MKTVAVDVTQDDIDYGLPRNYCACPVATATARALAPLWSTAPSHVYASVAGIFSTGVKPICELPQEAVQFICDYDSGNPVKPLQFEIQVADAVLAGQ